MSENSIIREQIDYYRLRASEYDEWHLREGRYDRGDKHKEKWFNELNLVRSALENEKPYGECLELACGTGLWTGYLAQGAAHLTAVDAVTETININRAKTRNENIRFEVVDIFKWEPSQKYDFIFFGFWLSHVPRDRFAHFWNMVRNSLKQGGKVFFVDSLSIQDSTARDHAKVNDSGISERKLNDGQSFKIVKIFHDPDQLNEQLSQSNFKGKIQRTGDFFYYGCMTVKDIH